MGWGGRRVQQVGRALIALISIGCASAGSMGGGRAPGSRDLITTAELIADSGPSAFESVERLRPFFFTDAQIHSRGQSPELPTTVPLVVYINMYKVGGVDALKSVPSSAVSSIRYVRPSDAMTRFGSGHTGGAIVVELLDRARR